MDIDDINDDDVYLNEEAFEEATAEDEEKKRRPPLESAFYHEKRRKLRKLPHIEDTVEIMRLMNRVQKDEPKNYNYRCGVCLTKHPNHNCSTCPCLDEIPEEITQIGSHYDTVCIGCGKIGDPPCCHKGTYATPKRCGGCNEYGHWYWEKKCPKDYVFAPLTAKLPGVEYEELSVPKKVNGTICQVPGYFKMKNVKSGYSNQSSKTWKRLGKKIVSGAKKIAL